MVLAQVPWDNPDGTAQTGNYDWHGGQNLTGNFGSPSNFGDSLFFQSANFDVTSSDGSTQNKTDVMNVSFTALDNKEFASIALYVFGDYTITDDGQPGGNQVEGHFGLTVDHASHGDSPWSDSFDYVETNPGSAVAWDDSRTLLFAYEMGPDIVTVDLAVDGETIAISDGEGGTASITANVALLQIAVEVIPEPASLSLLGLGALVLVRRRR
jgi:hypothetical protein